MHRKYGRKYLYKPDMKASVKHDCEDVQHDVQTKLKVFRSSALALNQIDNLDITFNSHELLILSKVNVKYWLRILVNSTAVTCSNKLNLSSL